MIKISPYAPYLNLLLRTPTEHKFLGGLISFPMAWCEQLGKLAMMDSKMNYTSALHWFANEPTQGSETDQGQKGAMTGSYKNIGACDTHRIKCKCQGPKLRVYTYSKNERLVSDRKKQYMEISNKGEIEYSIHCSMKTIFPTCELVVGTCSFIFLRFVAMCIIK